VVIVEDGVTIFAGTITQARERGSGRPRAAPGTGAPQIVTTITAEDRNRIAERITVTETVAAGTTLKAFLTTLVAGYLTGFGVTLDASQATGPALPAMSFDLSRASRCCRRSPMRPATCGGSTTTRSSACGCPVIWRPRSTSDQADRPAKWDGDVEVETILGDNYANRVTVICAPVEEEAHVEQFTGDGTTDTWDVGVDRAPASRVRDRRPRGRS
jgi:hypothetical protein